MKKQDKQNRQTQQLQQLQQASGRSYNHVVESKLKKQDRLQELLNGTSGRWVGFTQEEDQETAVELQLLTQKSGKIPAVFYD